MAPNDAAIRASQKPETMTPRRRITRTLGRGGNTHTRGNQCAFYAGLGRNHNATASCSTGAMPLHPVGVTAFRFISPCNPIRAKEVPAGDGWLHEVKFDGYRVQVHKVSSRVVVNSRNGHDFTARFPMACEEFQNGRHAQPSRYSLAWSCGCTRQMCSATPTTQEGVRERHAPKCPKRSVFGLNVECKTQGSPKVFRFAR